MRAAPTRRHALGLAVVAVSCSLASSAHAEDKKACMDAASSGQVLRDAHKLVEAREAFRVCAQQQCPTLVRNDCLVWLDATEKGLPTLVLSAKDGAGADLVDVNVTIDGTPTLSTLDGRSMPMNPGPHTFHFELADGTSADERVVLAEGSKDKQVSVVLGRPPVVVPVAAPPSAPPPPSPHSGPWTTVGWVTGGVGVAGLALGGVFGVLALTDKNSAHCKDGFCDAGPLSSARTAAAVSTVAFVAGGVLAASGLGIVLFAPKRANSDTTAVRAIPVAGPNQAGFAAVGTF
jgi:hypothetical protein